MRMDTDSRALGLLAVANKRTSYGGEKYFFKGDLVQMAKARSIAAKLGKETGTDGGIPFVMSWEDFDEVKQYIISHRIDGWWHYVSHEEKLKMK